MNNFSVILPAAGLGTRLKSNKPKTLTRFEDDSYLFEHQINLINEVFNHPPIYMVYGFQAEKIEKKVKDVHLIYNPDYADTNVAFSTYLGLEASKKKNALIIYGDLFFNYNMLAQIKNSGENSFVVIDQHNLEGDEVGCWDKNDSVQNFDYGFPYRWGQIAYLKKDEKENFIKHTLKNEKSLGFEILNKVIADGHRFDLVETEKDSVVVDIDSFRDVNRVNEILTEYNAE